MKYKQCSFLSFFIFLIACNIKNKSNDYKIQLANPLLYSKTVKALNDVVLENNFPPVIASRNYVYANIAAYECVAAGNGDYNSLHGQIKHLPKMPEPLDKTKLNFNLAALFAFTKVGNAVTFPEGSMMDYYNHLKNMADSLGMPKVEMDNTIAYSDSIVAAIMRWSKNDNYAQTRSAKKYSIEAIEGRWVPTPPMYAQALEPHWNEIRPMVLDSASQFLPPPPPPYDVKNKNSVFYKAMLQVKNIGDSLNEEQKNIADFWDDNPFKLVVSGHVNYATKKFSPPGHWMNIVGIAAKENKADFNTVVAAYAQTSISLYDGFIACWNEKFKSNLLRPESAINKNISDSWRPEIQTPPFPTYVSGHATISAAAAEVMSNWFGAKCTFSDTSSLEFGIKPRVIKSFREAAKEAALSRLYGGIHYNFDNEEGNKLGEKIGVYIVSNLKMKK